MAHYQPVTIPPIGIARGIHLAALHALVPPSVVWQTATGEIVESRETWPEGTTGLTATPNNPAVFGWQRLTPS